MLGLGIAALVAAWLPFSVMYVSALHHPPAAITAVGAPRGGTRIVTTASGASRVVASSPNHGGSATAAAAPAPVSTHAS